MDDATIASAPETGDEFDAIIDQALDERELRAYGGAKVFDHHHLRRNRVGQMARALAEGETYPIDRLTDLVYAAIDVKLQLYLAGEVVPGLINDKYYRLLHEDPGAANLASVQLVRLSLRQDLIVKVRILWERIMRLMYLIETGTTEIRTSGSRRSVKAAFFKMCSEHGRWKWVMAYEPQIEVFDLSLRTPEVHGPSTLRKMLLRASEPADLDQAILNMLSAGMNELWSNIESILRGQGVNHLSGTHIFAAGDDRDVFDVWGWQPGDDEELTAD
jgi:hypothetical protein